MQSKHKQPRITLQACQTALGLPQHYWAALAQMLDNAVQMAIQNFGRSASASMLAHVRCCICHLVVKGHAKADSCGLHFCSSSLSKMLRRGRTCPVHTSWKHTHTYTHSRVSPRVTGFIGAVQILGSTKLKNKFCFDPKLQICYSRYSWPHSVQLLKS